MREVNGVRLYLRCHFHRSLARTSRRLDFWRIMGILDGVSQRGVKEVKESGGRISVSGGSFFLGKRE